MEPLEGLQMQGEAAAWKDVSEKSVTASRSADLESAYDERNQTRRN